MSKETDLLRRAAGFLREWDEQTGGCDHGIGICNCDWRRTANDPLALADQMERIHRWAHLDEDAPSGTWGKGYEAARGWVRMQLTATQEPKP